MNCIQCSHELKEQLASFEGQYAGETFVVRVPGLVCEECGYQTLHAKQVDAYQSALADKYREKHKLLTGAQIRKLRAQRGMNQEQFAAYLNVGPASVKRWELGKVQDASMDELIRIKCDLYRAEQNVANVLLQQGGPADEFSGGVPFNFLRLQNAILLFLQEAASERKRIGPLHLNKLCWYADARHFAIAGTSITGTRYARLPLGPVPDDYRLIYLELQKRQVVRYQPDDTLLALATFDADPFTDNQIGVLRATWQKFHNKLTKIVAESHQEPAWKKTQHCELISYTLVSRTS
jgi:putative zinc finger/helix-turn-helix YgiT family protein